MTLQEFEALLIADVAKAPTLLADLVKLRDDSETLLIDAGVPIPWAGVASAHADAFEQSVVAHKLGDGSLLKGLGAFLQSPLGQSLLQLLLGAIGKPAPTGA